MDNHIFTLGVLGLGEGRSIMSAALTSDMWRLGNICDLNEELCKQRCEEFHFDKYTLDYEEMLKDPVIDVIGIYTPDQLHAKHIIMALEAGKHVICTKPLRDSLDPAIDLLEAQKKSGKKVFVGQSSRYFEPMLHQRADYEAGKHGEIAMIETHYIGDHRWMFARDWCRNPDFTWLYQCMVHSIDLAIWYLGDVTEVYGVGRTTENTKEYGVNVPDMLAFILKNGQGLSAVVEGGYTTPALDTDVQQTISCTIRGTKGISQAGYPRLKYDTNFNAESAGPDHSSHEGMEHKTFQDKHGYYFRFEGETHHAGEYQNYLEYFARCLNQGETPTPDIREGVHTMAVVEAMAESLRTNQVVKVQDILSKRNIQLS